VGFSPTAIGWTTINYIRYVGNLPLELAGINMGTVPEQREGRIQ